MERRVLLECNFCKETLPTKDILHAHIRSHTEEKHYSCCKCPMSFATAGALLSHAGSHFKTGNSFNRKIPAERNCPTSELQPNSRFPFQGSYTCARCGAGFEQHSSLVAHVRTHTSGNPFKCVFCDADFPTQGGLAHHIKKHKRDRKKLAKAQKRKNLHTCRACKIRFSLKENLELHLKMHRERFNNRNNPAGINLDVDCQDDEDATAALKAICDRWASFLSLNLSPNVQIEKMPSCKQCNFACLTEEMLCRHNSTCHGLPLVQLERIGMQCGDNEGNSSNQ